MGAATGDETCGSFTLAGIVCGGLGAIPGAPKDFFLGIAVLMLYVCLPSSIAVAVLLILARRENASPASPTTGLQFIVGASYIVWLLSVFFLTVGVARQGNEIGQEGASAGVLLSFALVAALLPALLWRPAWAWARRVMKDGGPEDPGRGAA